MIASELQVWRDTETLVSYLIDVTMKFPKSYKFTVGQKITNVSLELFEYIQLANMTKDEVNRQRYLQGFQVKFELLKVLLRLSTEKKDCHLEADRDHCSYDSGHRQTNIRLEKQTSV